ncbi:hypothetical protein ACOME3_010134 [Neoechinorhynchus agilis]
MCLIEGIKTRPQIPLRLVTKDSAELGKAFLGEGVKIDIVQLSLHPDDSTKSTETSEGEFETPVDRNKQRELLKAGKTEGEPEKRYEHSSSGSSRTPIKSSFEEDTESWRYSDKIRVKDYQIESLVPSQMCLIEGISAGPKIPLRPKHEGFG